MSEKKVILELSSWERRPYRVEVQEHGWDWREWSSWSTKAAAFTEAERLSGVSSNSVRVVKEPS